MRSITLPAPSVDYRVARELDVERPVLLVTTAHPTLLTHRDPQAPAFLHPHLGRLLQPRHTSSAEATADAGIPWAADNDCFQGLNAPRFIAMLDRIAGLPGCRFVTVPDVVGDARGTARQFELWAPALERRGLPVGLVAQDGLETPELQRWLDSSWHRLDALFIGGSTDWKLGPHAADLAREAKRRGLWVHWGRVNTQRRIDHVVNSDACDSLDGSKWARFRKTYLDDGLEYVRRAAARRRDELRTQTMLELGELLGAQLDR